MALHLDKKCDFQIWSIECPNIPWDKASNGDLKRESKKKPN